MTEFGYEPSPNTRYGWDTYDAPFNKIHEDKFLIIPLQYVDFIVSTTNTS